MNNKKPPLGLGITALVIVFVLFLLSIIVKSMEPVDEHWYWNSPMIMWMFIYPIFAPFAAVGTAKSAIRIRYKEERDMAITSTIISGMAFVLGIALIVCFIMYYQTWPRFWITD